MSGKTVQFPEVSQLCEALLCDKDSSPAEKRRKLVSLPLLETTDDSAESLDPVEDSVLGALNKVIGIKNHSMQCRGLGDPKQFAEDTWKVLGPTRFDKFREDPIEEFSSIAPDPDLGPDSDDAPAIATGSVAAGEGTGATHLTSMTSKIGADTVPPFSAAVGAPAELQVSGAAIQVSGSWDACSGALTIVVQYPPSLESLDSLDQFDSIRRGASGQAGSNQCC